MDDTLHAIVTNVQNRFNLEMSESRGETTLFTPAEKLVEVIQSLRENYNFHLLVDITAVDYWPEMDPRFHLVYQLVSLEPDQVLRLRVPVIGTSPHVPTVEGIFPGANWYEREVWDMFGVKFDNHSDMRRIIMPADWEGHPLRKDYPLGYEEVQFTFNFDEINLHKPRPKE